MTSRHRFAIGVGLALLLVPCVAHGDDVRELPRPTTSLDSGDGTLAVPSGLIFTVPRGSLILRPDARSALDLELKRLQETETRLAAENSSLRKTADEWRPGWVVVTSAIVAGLVGGVYAGAKL